MNWTQIRKQWTFYFRHSLRDLMRNGSRTTFALFCIATGVAAVVALRSLALMIGDELTTNLAELNRGDIQIVPSSEIDSKFYQDNNQNERVFSTEGMQALRDWADEQDVEIQFASSRNFVQMLPLNDDGSLRTPVSAVAILVDPVTYPYYGAVFSTDETPLSEIFHNDDPILVLSQRAARDNRLSVGDQVQVSGMDTWLTLTYIIDDELEGNVLLRNGPAGLLGFMYYPLDRADEIGLTPLPDAAFVRLNLGRDVNQLDSTLTAKFGSGISRISTSELEDQNQETANLINDLILVMGLSSILIGGIGIVNTMQVIVSRRTLEIAVLKTIGLKAWRVTILFLVEAALMGLIGSLMGVVAGTILSYAVRGVGEDVLQTSLSWRAYPEAWFSGITLGIIVTIAFGFLPTLIAGQVRPAVVLRPNDLQLPSAGLNRTLIALVFIIITFGLTLNIIVQGRLELSPVLMLGLGFAIIGLFGGVILFNQGILEAISDESDEQAIQRGRHIMTGSITGLLLVMLFGMSLFTDLNQIIIYGVPMLVGTGTYFGLQSITKQRPHIALRTAYAARQVVLAGGALILGALVAGGIFAIFNTVIEILYPDGSFSTERRLVAGSCVLLGLLCSLAFRFRSQRAVGIIGLALIGGAVSGALGFGIGRLLDTLLDSTPLWQSIESFSVGIIVVEITILALGVAYVVMWLLVWAMGKAPSFNNVDVKLSLRNISTRKGRTASTMLGLTAGIAALSLITLTTSAVTNLLETQIETNAGGNVFIIASDRASSEAVRKRLDSRLEGVNSYTQFNVYRGRIMAVNGEVPDIEGFEFGDAADGNRNEFGQIEGQDGIGFAFAAIDPALNTLDYTMKDGRFLTIDDLGQRVMVMREPFPGSFLDQLGVKVGSTITWKLGQDGAGAEPLEINFTIIGMIDRDSEQSGGGDALQVPMNSVPESVSPDSLVTVADIQDEYVDAAMIEFAQLSNVFAIELDFIVQLIERLLDQLVAIPTLVALLSLLAGIAIIANTVALDTQERRRQIGILKAVGLKGYRVLAQMTFENALIGLVAGMIGAGIGLLATILVGVLGDADQVSQTLQLEPAFALVGVAVLMSVLATLISAWSAARESPMEVLRYE